MNDEEILTRLSTLIEDLLGVDDLHVTRATTALDAPGWNSLAHVRIVVATEQAFGVRFTTGEIVSLKTVGDLVDLIKARSPR
ncbi:MAG: acyl carrier protein [Terriglobales bacterium]